MESFELTEKEVSTIHAALLYWQEALDLMPGDAEDFLQDRTYKVGPLLNADEITTLCDKIIPLPQGVPCR